MQTLDHIQIPQNSSIDPGAFDPTFFQNNPTATPRQQTFLPEFQQQQTPISMLAPSPTNLMPQIDMSPFPELASTPHPAAHSGAFWNMDPMGSSFFADPSTAWFLPFNVDPPTLGDDGGVFAPGEAFNFSGLGNAGHPPGEPVMGAGGARQSVSAGQGQGHGMEGLELDNDLSGLQ
jgi:hypothetical protein